MTTVAGLVARILTHPELGNAVEKRWRSNRNRLLRYAVASIGDAKLTDLVPAHLWSLQQAYLQRGLAPSTVNKITHNCLHGALTIAVAEGYIQRSTVDRLYAAVRRLREPAPAGRAPWTRLERDEILAYFAGTESYRHYLPFVAWQFFTGCRPGESLALTWGCLDRQRRWARIAASVGSPTTKTPISIRELRLARVAVAAVAQLPRGPVTDLVFLGPRGSPINLGNFTTRTWQPAMKALAGQVTPRVFYCTRHTFISHALESKTPQEVARYVGDNPTQILKTYFRWTKPVEAEEWDDALDVHTDLGAHKR